MGEDHHQLPAILHTLLLSGLSYILPEAAFWWQADIRPRATLAWVVSPYTHHLIRCTYTSVALLQEDELLCGVYLNYQTQEIVTGEKNGGTSIFEEKRVVNNQHKNENSRYLIHLNKPETITKEQILLLDQYTGNGSIRPVYNLVVENPATSIINVAANDLDIAIGLQFHFASVAAAKITGAGNG